MFGLGYQELLLILVIVLILFGAQRLPDLARSLGSSVKEFKKGVTELKDDATAAAKKDDEKKVVARFPLSPTTLLGSPMYQVLFTVGTGSSGGRSVIPRVSHLLP